MNVRDRIVWAASALTSALAVVIWTPIYNATDENPAVGMVIAIFAGMAARACFVLWREWKERYEVEA